jgi:hypothetical protein
MPEAELAASPHVIPGSHQSSSAIMSVCSQYHSHSARPLPLHVTADGDASIPRQPTSALFTVGRSGRDTRRRAFMNLPSHRRNSSETVRPQNPPTVHCPLLVHSSPPHGGLASILFSPTPGNSLWMGKVSSGSWQRSSKRPNSRPTRPQTANQWDSSPNRLSSLECRSIRDYFGRHGEDPCPVRCNMSATSRDGSR